MTGKRWFWAGVIVLAVLLVPALVLSQRRPAAVQDSVPPAPAAEGNDLQPADEEGEAGQAGSRLYLVSETPSTVAVVEAASGAVEWTLAQAALAPDASFLYEVRQAGNQTRVRALEAGTGQVAGELAFDGSYGLAGAGPIPGGFAPGGRWLVLQQMQWGEGTSPGNSHSRFAVVDLALDTPPRLVDLDGQFLFDALSDDGTRLYLTEYLDQEAPYDDYRVRLYSLAENRLDPAAIADKRNGEKEMAGYHKAAVASPGGDWLYSLYLRPRSGIPFVHALNLDKGYAFCIDLPDVRPRQEIRPDLWGLALSPGGETLYVVNGAAGIAHEIDTAGAAVRRSVELEAPGAGSGLLERLLVLLAPVARAKVGVVNPVVLAPDGGTLYALGATGILVVDTEDLEVRGHYLSGYEYHLNSLAVSGDGKALYAVSLEPNRLLRLEPETGKIVAAVAGKGYWSGILAVAGTTPEP